MYDLGCVDIRRVSLNSQCVRCLAVANIELLDVMG